MSYQYHTWDGKKKTCWKLTIVLLWTLFHYKKRIHWDGSNITIKGCTITPKKIAPATKATTQKVNQTKYH